MYCGKCGSVIPNEDSFCSVCGAPINSSATKSPEQLVTDSEQTEPTVNTVPQSKTIVRKNGVATAGLVFGILAAVASLAILSDISSVSSGYEVKIVGIYTFAILGVIFSPIGLVKSRHSGGKGKASAGLILSICGFLLPVLVLGIGTYMNKAPTNTTSSGSVATSGATTTTTEATTSVPTFANGLSENDFNIQEHLINPSFDKENTHCLLEIKNNSSEYIQIIIFEVTAYDSKDNVIATETTNANYLAPGEETLCHCSFENVKGIDHITRKITNCQTGSFDPVNVETKLIAQNKYKLVFSIMNNNTNRYFDSCFIYVLLYDQDGNLVNYSVGGVLDTIPPGNQGVATVSIIGINYDTCKSYCIPYLR